MAMDLNPNVMMDLARMRHQERLVATQKARLARTTAPDRHSPLEPAVDVEWWRRLRLSAR
jgi:hypothetical protein